MPLRHSRLSSGPASLRRQGLLRWGAVGVFLALALGTAGFRWYPGDRTKWLSPMDVVREAGLAVLTAERYRFEVDLSGAPGDTAYPAAQMSGIYQRQPQVLHLKGSTTQGINQVPLQYYLDGQDLYMQDPQDASWMLLRRADLSGLSTFQPDRLAAPLVEGLRGATVLGRERIAGGEAVVLRLELDAAMMKPRLGGANPQDVQYKLWVYTRSLKPARFVIEHRPGEQVKAAGYRYELSWAFSRTPRVEVPAKVKGEARPMPQA